MTKLTEHFLPGRTPQNEKARAEQVANNAGGFVFEIDKWKRLERFLILGAEGGTYYVGAHELVRENAASLVECLAEDGPRAVAMIVDISDRGRAPKNDAAIFALAMAASVNDRPADEATRKAALAAVSKVCRTGTHLFSFVDDVEKMRGWGRGLRRAVGSWYTERPADRLAMQVVKYQQRGGRSHRDVLRLASPTPTTKEHDAVFRWVVGGGTSTALDVERHRAGPGKIVGRGRAVVDVTYPAIDHEDLPMLLLAFEELRATKSAKDAARIVRETGLPHECVPNELKSDPEIWEALLPEMGLTALVRNLGKMTSIGLLAPMSAATKKVVTKLVDPVALRAQRVHPMTLLLASKVYEQGHGEKGSLTWQPSRAVLDALDEAFYAAFEAIEPTGKRHMLALDVSGSMSSPISGGPISCRVASAALAMVTARTEREWHAVGFTSSHGRPASAGPFAGLIGGQWGGPSSGLTDLAISPKQRIADVVKEIEKLPMGGTDCSLPMQDAMRRKIPVDVFVVLTDNETWHGAVHPFQALRDYRQAMGIGAKLIVVAMTASRFSIADPNDAGMMDVVGFDASAPAVMADFAR